MLPLLASLAAAQEPRVLGTEHYRLECQGDLGDGEEYGRVLEAAWPQYRKFFGADPKLAKGEKLRVRTFAAREEWAQALRADRAIPPEKAGGYYWPATKTAYLYRQPTRSYTRTLLLHEAAHQFHYLARTRNKPPGAGWYAEGIAEYLAEHYWDGEALQLGVLQRVTLKDYPRQALEIAGADGFDLAAQLQGQTPRPLGWALIRYLATKPHPRFSKLCKKLDGGATGKSIFTKTVGKPKKLQADFARWLADEQEPWTQVFNEWNGVGPDSIRGFAKVVSFCRLKAPAKRLEATLVAPEGGRFKGGLLLAYRSPDDYRLALLDSGGTLRLQRRRDGQWQVEVALQGLVLPKDAIPILAERTEAGVSVTLCGKTAGPWAFEDAAFGLALEDCDLVFRRLAWE